MAALLEPLLAGGHNEDWIKVPTSQQHALGDSDRKRVIEMGELAQTVYDGFIEKDYYKCDKVVPKKGGGMFGWFTGMFKKKDKGEAYEAKRRYRYMPGWKSQELLDQCLSKNSDARRWAILTKPSKKYGQDLGGLIFAYSGPRTLSTPAARLGGLFAKAKPVSWVGYMAFSKETVKESTGPVTYVDLVVVWRGTIVFEEWLSNALGDALEPWSYYQSRAQWKSKKKNVREDGPPVRVHAGFAGIYNGTVRKPGHCNRELMSPRVLIRKYIFEMLQHKYVLLPGERLRSITTTGHSLGGALAILSAYDLQCLVHDLKKDEGSIGDQLKYLRPVECFAFAPPKVGNAAFVDVVNGTYKHKDKKLEAEYKDLQTHILRIVNSKDIVPKVPGLLNTASKNSWLMKPVVAGVHFFSRAWNYAENVGKLLLLDSDNTKVLSAKKYNDSGKAAKLGICHNMELYTWMVATQYQLRVAASAALMLGAIQEVESAMGGRDVNLLNKGGNILSEEVFRAFGKPDVVPENGWWRAAHPYPKELSWLDRFLDDYKDQRGKCLCKPVAAKKEGTHTAAAAEVDGNARVVLPVTEEAVAKALEEVIVNSLAAVEEGVALEASKAAVVNDQEKVVLVSAVA